MLALCAEPAGTVRRAWTNWKQVSSRFPEGTLGSKDQSRKRPENRNQSRMTQVGAFIFSCVDLKRPNHEIMRPPQTHTSVHGSGFLSRRSTGSPPPGPSESRRHRDSPPTCHRWPPAGAPSCCCDFVAPPLPPLYLGHCGTAREAWWVRTRCWRSAGCQQGTPRSPPSPEGGGPAGPPPSGSPHPWFGGGLETRLHLRGGGGL